MPVKIPSKLPARAQLEAENIFVMTEKRALSQDIRPLKVAILNLMPNKEQTETQLLRLISNTPIQVEISLLHTSSYDSKHVDKAYLKAFYTTFDECAEKRTKFDGMIITGAPVEKLDFKDVQYWNEVSRVMNWAKHNVQSTLHICWAAQAGVYLHYGVDKHALANKLTGIFKHKLLRRDDPLVRGFDDEFYAPHSRYTESDAAALKCVKGLKILAESEEAGIYLCASEDKRNVFAFGHGEYDLNSLDSEYKRDLKSEGAIAPKPVNYYDGEALMPLRWRAHESLLLTNWLNYYVYQEAPYDIEEIL